MKLPQLAIKSLVPPRGCFKSTARYPAGAQDLFTSSNSVVVCHNDGIYWYLQIGVKISRVISTVISYRTSLAD